MKIYFYILVLIIFLSFGFDFIYHISPYELDSSAILLPPSSEHLFGTDRLGRDILARVFQGGQVSLIIGFLSAGITSFVGLIVGISAGYFKGYVDKSIVLFIDLFLTFPTFFLLLALISYIDASMVVLIVVISITSWMSIARLIRSESFAITNKPFIKILKIANVSTLKIILKYYTPLLLPIFLVSFTFGVGGAILAESGLSFLGLGINPPMVSWGTILNDGKTLIDIAWWVSFFPGLMIFIVTFCLIKISNKLQEKLNTTN
jgi:peptide/nickel transport system permease protein